MLPAFHPPQGQMGAKGPVLGLEAQGSQGRLDGLVQHGQGWLVTSKPHPDDAHLFDGRKRSAAEWLKAKRRARSRGGEQGLPYGLDLLRGNAPEKLEGQVYPVGPDPGYGSPGIPQLKGEGRQRFLSLPGDVQSDEAANHGSESSTTGPGRPGRHTPGHVHGFRRTSVFPPRSRRASSS